MTDVFGTSILSNEFVGIGRASNDNLGKATLSHFGNK